MMVLIYQKTEIRIYPLLGVEVVKNEFFGVFIVSLILFFSHTHTHTEKTEYIDTKMLTLLYGHLWLVRL